MPKCDIEEDLKVMIGIKEKAKWNERDSELI